MKPLHISCNTYLNFLNRPVINWIILLILCSEIIFQSIVTANISSSNSSVMNCNLVFKVMEARGIRIEDIPKKPINEIVLHYCELSSIGSCCTYNIEAKLAAISKHDFEKSTKEYIGKLHSVLTTRAQKFNEFFTQLLSESKSEFDAMFKRTYGITYEVNSYVFSDFFSELEAYFARGKINLSETMDSFFNTLYQKLFTVLHKDYSFDDKYLGCISEHMKELKPFGDVPDKLSVQIKRSFVATRTYAQALSTAADVVKNMINVRPNMECSSSLTKMSQCGLCKGYVAKPCPNYCVNVAKGCLQYYNDLDYEWDNFVLSMEKVSERLLGPFNIVMVVEPINIKISEAIMNFQETGPKITEQVFQGCGHPQLGLQKRFVQNYQQSTVQQKLDFKNNENQTQEIINATQKYEMKSDAPSSPREYMHSVVQRDIKNTNAQSDSNQKRKTNKRKQNKSTSKTADSKEPTLDKLIKDIRQKIKDSKKFWSNLPYQLCNREEVAISSKMNYSCWDGNNVISDDSNLSSHVSPTLSSMGSTTRQTAIVGNQLYYLKTAINNLHNAYIGQDVEWTDQEESYYGSGSGSGNGINYEDEDGSGLSSLENATNLPDNSSVWTNKNNRTSATNTTDFKQFSLNVEGESIAKTNNAVDYTKMPLRRTLITFFLPIFVTWFGSIVSDLL